MPTEQRQLQPGSAEDEVAVHGLTDARAAAERIIKEAQAEATRILSDARRRVADLDRIALRTAEAAHRTKNVAPFPALADGKDDARHDLAPPEAFEAFFANGMPVDRARRWFASPPTK